MAKAVFVRRDFDIGFATRKKWPTKRYWASHTVYYDGIAWTLHVGWFYLVVYL